jgi:hypothetical protein
MGDGRDTSRPGRKIDQAARAALSTMAGEGLCLAYRYGTGRFYLTKGQSFPGRPASDDFDQEVLNWLMERGWVTDTGEPPDEDECRYFLTAEGRRQGQA